MHVTKISARSYMIPRIELFYPRTPSLIKFLKAPLLVILFSALFACGGGSNNGAPGAGLSFQLNNDSYNTFGNTSLEIGVSPGGTIAVRLTGSVLDNDTSDPGVNLTVTAVTPGSGAVTMNPDGSFNYIPAIGLVGVDTFSYDVSDGTDTATADVTIAIDNRIWYVDNTGNGAAGTSLDPFSTLMDAQLVAQSGDSIYISGDSSGNGMDQGLSLTESNINVIGAGVPLLIDGIVLAPSGAVPTITNSTANVVNLDNITNTLIAGVTINASVADGIFITNSSAITLQDMTIQNSGESAIEGEGAALGLSLNNVSITNSDSGDSSISDDAIFLHPTASVSLNMTGGLIDGVPGNLGDGIVLLNTDNATIVDMELTVQSVSFANIAQDAIKLDNENGLVDVLIGGSQLSEGNDFSAIGYRGIVIMSDGDPLVLPADRSTNSVIISSNSIGATHEAIQVRGIDDLSQLTVSNNIIDTDANAIITSAIDLQYDNSVESQARVINNSILGNTVSTGTGLRVRLFDGAKLAVEAGNNTLDNLNTAFALAARETTGLIGVVSSLDSTITDNELINIALPDLAMRAVNYHTSSETCLDLRNNSAVSDYAVEVPDGVFNLTINSQTVNLTGTITDTPLTCQLPSF